MLAYIKGTVLCKVKGAVIVLAGNIGYRISVTDGLAHTLREEQALELYTHQYVRETSAELYGFGSLAEVSFFEQLLTVSGVGPKTALAILNSAPIEKIKSAIARGDKTLFRGISGVGTKTAERIFIELRGRMHVLEGEIADSGNDADIIEALVRLGYAPAVARLSVQSLPDSLEEVEKRMKAALKSLAKK